MTDAFVLTDTAAMAERLDCLLSDPSIASHTGQSARQRLIEDFSPAAASARWSALLASVSK